MTDNSAATCLAFTKDPIWQAEREALWDSEQFDSLREDLPRKKIKLLKQIFMTGLKPQGLECQLRTWLELYPNWTNEGLAYLFSELMPTPNERNQEELEFIFLGGLDEVADLSVERSRELFGFIFGECYDPLRRFPFLFKGEAESRTIATNPNIQFFRGTNQLRLFLKYGDEDRHKTAWSYHVNYWVSLIANVDPRAFPKDKPAKRVYDREKNFSYDRFLFAKLSSVLTLVCCEPQGERDAEYLPLTQCVIKEIRTSLDNLDHYPGQLKELWEKIKTDNGVAS